MRATSRERIKRTYYNPEKIMNKNDKSYKNIRGRTPEHKKFTKINITNKPVNIKKIHNNRENNIIATDRKKYRTKSDLMNGNSESGIYYPTQITSNRLSAKEDNVIKNNKILHSATKKKNCKQSVDELHTSTFTKTSYVNIFSNNYTTKNNSSQKKNYKRIKVKGPNNNKTKLKHNNYTHINIMNKPNNINKKKEKEKNATTTFKKRTETKPIVDRNEKLIMTPCKKKKNVCKTQINDLNNKYNNNNYNEKKTKKKFIDKSRSTKKNNPMTRNDDLEKKNNTLPKTLNYEENINNINTEKKLSIKNNHENIIDNIDDIKLTENEKPKLINNSQKDIFTNNNIDDIDNDNKNAKTNLRLYNQMSNSLKTKNITTERKQSAHNNSVVERIIFAKNITKLLNSNKIFKGKKVEKIGIISKAGELAMGEVKTNQDNYFNYDLCNDYIYIGVCDGHGEDGHHISEYIKNTLPDEFNHLLEKLYNEEKENLGITNQEIKDDIEIRKKIEKIDKIKDIFTDAFKNTNIFAIEECAEYNLEYSGSTCVSILLHKKKANKLFISNIGDSRTIIIKKKNNNYFSHQLSRDHKPTEEDEAKRILENGGEIQQIEDENGNWTGPLRIWQKGENGPGLAMTRSFCDVVASMLGVTCEPEVFEYKLREEDQMVIIASDGLFEYVSNEEVSKICGDVVDNNKECEDVENKVVEELYKESNKRWKDKGDGIDDITIICVMLKNS